MKIECGKKKCFDGGIWFKITIINIPFFFYNTAWKYEKKNYNLQKCNVNEICFDTIVSEKELEEN